MNKYLRTCLTKSFKNMKNNVFNVKKFFFFSLTNVNRH